MTLSFSEVSAKVLLSRIRNVIRANLAAVRDPEDVRVSSGERAQDFSEAGCSDQAGRADEKCHETYRAQFCTQNQGNQGVRDFVQAYSPEELKYYANLEVSPGAAWSEIRASYHQLLLRYHPDRFGNDPRKRILAGELTAELNRAWTELKKRRQLQKGVF